MKDAVILGACQNPACDHAGGRPLYEGGCAGGGNWEPDGRGYCPLCRPSPSPMRDWPGDQDASQPAMFARQEN